MARNDMLIPMLRLLEKIPGKRWSLAQMVLATLLLPLLPFYLSSGAARAAFDVLATLSLILGVAGQGRLAWIGIQERSSWSLAACGILLGLGGAAVQQTLEVAFGSPIKGIAWDLTYLVAFLMCAAGILFLPGSPADEQDRRSRLRFQLDYFTHIAGVAYLQLTVVIFPLIHHQRRPLSQGIVDFATPLLTLLLSLATADAVVRKRQVGHQELAMRFLAMASVVNLMGDTCFHAFRLHGAAILFGFRHWLLVLVSLGTSVAAWLLSESSEQEAPHRLSFLDELVLPQLLLPIPLLFLWVFWVAGLAPGSGLAAALFLMLVTMAVRLVVFSFDVQRILRQKEAALADLRSAQFHLVENGKLSALGSLVAGVAHEMNTPLGNALTATTNISAQLSVFRQRLVGNTLPRSSLEKFLESLDRGTSILTTSLERSADLVRSFKQVQVEPSLEPSTVLAVRPFLEQSARLLTPLLQAGNRSLTVDCSPALRGVLPRMTLTQIIDQLLRNAHFHAFVGREGGSIRLRARAEQELLVLEVEDDGIGMDAAILERLYDPFFTTRRDQGSLGLGAHLVHSLVTQRLGGRIETRSRPAQGTTVSIEIPGVVIEGERP